MEQDFTRLNSKSEKENLGRSSKQCDKSKNPNKLNNLNASNESSSTKSTKSSNKNHSNWEDDDLLNFRISSSESENGILEYETETEDEISEYE